MTPEEISGGREPRRGLRLAGAVVVLVLLAALGTDRAVRHQERRALARCVAAAEADLDDLTRRSAGLEQYISGTVDRPDVAPSVRASLRGIVQTSVARSLPALQQDRTGCARVGRWDGAVRTARSDYLAYLDLRLGQARRAVTDLDALHTFEPALPRARAAASSSLAEVAVRLSP